MRRYVFDGSSPPVRGTPGRSGGARRGDRFIPARAGNTICNYLRVVSPAVHPRPCGEHSVQIGGFFAGDGSSPPVRGTRVAVGRAAHVRRFIPARAGNTLPSSSLSLLESVHPRPCGEHPRSLQRSTAFIGSSPPVRGTLYRPHLRGSDERFIPARAGNTSPIFQRRCARAVHPRPCGEHTEGLSGSSTPIGSSPPVRGTRFSCTCPPAPARFIPARAGNTLPTKD